MSHYSPRADAVWHDRRRYVPTGALTKWVGNWQEFEQAGGLVHFNEDQTEIVLTLPAGFKFGCGFQRR